MTTLYGIKNCDTIKKARKWLEKNNINYKFYDYRTDGLSAEQLAEFVSACDWQSLLNTRGTTFRNLPETDKADLTESKALSLMLAQPAMIKRPLLCTADNHYYLGFSEQQYQQIFGISS